MGVRYAELIGDPVAHSKSPLIHSFWLEQLGLEGDYRATRVQEADLADYFAARREDPDWRGCNVTMPLKRSVQPWLSLDPPTRRIGAVNTIVTHESGLLMGTNTDLQGLNFALDTQRLSPSSAAIVGTGGAARAVLEEMRRAGVERVVLISRAPKVAQALLADFGLTGGALPLGETPGVDLLINASPLGMTGYPPLEIDLSRLRSTATVMDMVYEPKETPLLGDARKLGLCTIEGLSMLIGQAAMAFTYFFGEPPAEPFDSNELRGLLEP